LFDAIVSAFSALRGQIADECTSFAPDVAEIGAAESHARPDLARTFCSTRLCPLSARCSARSLTDAPHSRPIWPKSAPPRALRGHIWRERFVRRDCVRLHRATRPDR
jgi:hypothetical protein